MENVAFQNVSQDSRETVDHSDPASGLGLGALGVFGLGLNSIGLCFIFFLSMVSADQNGEILQ